MGRTIWKKILASLHPSILAASQSALGTVSKMILNAGISSKYTVAIGLYKMLDKSLINSYFTQFCAGGVLVSIPISILFMIMQKFYVEGITGGAVKG